MKNMTIKSFIIFTALYNSAIMQGKALNTVRPTFQTLAISNKTSMPLTINIKAYYSRTNQQTSGNSTTYESSQSASLSSDEQTITLQPGQQSNFSYRCIKTTRNNTPSYQGGLATMDIYDQNNTLLAQYTSIKEPNGLQHFEGQQAPGFSYNFISIYQNGQNITEPIYLSYDQINLTVAALQNPQGNQVEYNNTTGGLDRF